MNNFQRTENIKPCMPFARNLAFKPRPNKPHIPPEAMTFRAASANKAIIMIKRKKYREMRTIRDLEWVHLFVGFDHPQGI